MNEQQSELDLLKRSAAALELLQEVIVDPAAKAREKLKAVRMLKLGLFWLTRLAVSQETDPNLCKVIIEILKRHRWVDSPPTKLTRAA
jgi:hypothetical protein